MFRPELTTGTDMGDHEYITPELRQWMAAQPLYFLATAPLAGDGHVNLSPRGLDTLRVADPHRVLVLDLTGSGNETAAHLAENGRITVMLCAFSGPPRILRLYGTGRVVPPGAAEFAALRGAFPAALPGVRQIFDIAVRRVRTSCGFGVPLMDFRSQRRDLLDWAEKKGTEGLAGYRRQRNAVSLDGLPAPLDESGD